MPCLQSIGDPAVSMLSDKTKESMTTSTVPPARPTGSIAGTPRMLAMLGGPTCGHVPCNRGL